MRPNKRPSKPESADDKTLAWVEEWPNGSCGIARVGRRRGESLCDASGGPAIFRAPRRAHNLPRRRGQRRDAELFGNEAVAERRIVDHVDVRRRRLVVHGPRAIQKDHLPRGDGGGHVGDGAVARRLDPALEESLLHVRKSAVGIVAQVLKHGADREPRVCVLDSVVAARAVLVDCLEPTDVVVAVRH